MVVIVDGHDELAGIDWSEKKKIAGTRVE